MGKFADVILINKNNEMLLLKRNEDNDFMPGKWGLPGGHVDNDEIYDAGIRECEEETGIKPKHLTKMMNHEFKNGATTTIFIAFEETGAFELKRPVMLTRNEHCDKAWVHILQVLYMKDLMPELSDILREIFIGKL